MRRVAPPLSLTPSTIFASGRLAKASHNGDHCASPACAARADSRNKVLLLCKLNPELHHVSLDAKRIFAQGAHDDRNHWSPACFGVTYSWRRWLRSWC